MLDAVAAPGLDARAGAEARLGQRRLCPRRGGQGSARRGGAPARTARPVRRGTPAAGAARRRDLAARAPCWWSPASGGCWTCSRPPLPVGAGGIAIDLSRTRDRARRSRAADASRMSARSTSCHRRSRSSTAPKSWFSPTPPIASSGRSTPASSISIRAIRRNSRPAARRAPPARTGRLPRLEKRACSRPITRSIRRRQIWHLPDGRTLRVVFDPNPQGGITYLFDDVTERFTSGIAI